jgi:NitT/TauT family transport system substrate-binding protein
MGWDRRWTHLSLAISTLVLLACGQTVSSGIQSSDDGPLTLRLGYFPNLTHAPALIGLGKGLFTDALGNKVKLETRTFNAGSEAVTAILSDSVDATFVGPNPTTNAFVQSHGKAVRVIAGATSGGALLVVKPTINSVGALKGKKIADPQLGGTQDIALRWFLKGSGFSSNAAGGGDVSVIPQDNAQTLTAFKQGQIDGAWLPEPWASRLTVEGGGRVLIDERDLWPQAQFVTTNLVVSTNFLRDHPNRVKALLEGLYQAIAFLNANSSEAQKLTNDAMAEITGQRLAAGVVSGAWPHLTFTLDPLASTLQASADHAQSLGFLASANLSSLYNLTILNEVLLEHQQATVNGL